MLKTHEDSYPPDLHYGVSVPTVPPGPNERTTDGTLVSIDVDEAVGDVELGWLPAISIVTALGLFVVAFAHMRARAGLGGAETLFWLGLAVTGIPIALRVCATSSSRIERIGLTLLFGVALYLVKVMHSPIVFTFSDEQLHLTTALAIQNNQRLFQANFILPSVGVYPGLEAITVGVAQVSGLSLFAVGLIVIGLARFVLMLALFLLYETVSGSTRVAALGAMLYAGNWNFLFWSAQFSYESLALPLMLSALVVVAQLSLQAGRVQPWSLVVVVVPVICAIVMTHHMTSYVLLVVLTSLYLLNRWYFKLTIRSIWGLILIALVATLGWLIFFASLTVSYLSVVLGRAVLSVFRLLLGLETGRQLFISTVGDVPPLLERITGIASAGIVAACLPLGVWLVWRHYRTNVFALLFAVLALGFYPVMIMRFTAAGWETSNRASEFLYIGIAFILAMVVVRYVLSVRWRFVSRAALMGGLAIIVAGGVIGGWPPKLRLGRPIVVSTGSALIPSQPVAAGQWMQANLTPSNRIGAPAAEALTAYLIGDQRPLTGSRYGLRDALLAPHFGQNEQNILQSLLVRYVVLDWRRVSWDNMRGVYFDLANEPTPLFEPVVFQKFDSAPQVDRIYDSGHVVIYDLARLPE